MPARAPRPGMGIATQQSVDNKMIYKSYLDSYVDGNHQEINQAIQEIEQNMQLLLANAQAALNA